MEFISKASVDKFMKKNKNIGFGQEGECFVDSKRELVYKFYNSFLDSIEDENPSKERILAFKDVKTELVMFPQDIIVLENRIIGDVTKYANGKNLYKTNPFSVDLNRLIRLCEIAIKEIELLAKQGVQCYDVLYNILLGDKLYLIDGKDYIWSKYGYTETLSSNMRQFNLSIMYFLVAKLFEEVISKNKILEDMFKTEGRDITITEFIIELKNYLSELVGKEIKTLEEARSLVDKKKSETPYIRLLEL